LVTIELLTMRTSATVLRIPHAITDRSKLGLVALHSVLDLKDLLGDDYATVPRIRKPSIFKTGERENLPERIWKHRV